jgi:hypothetical protein
MDNKVLGEAEIVVYKKGERIILDTKSPYFKELQAACEEILVPPEPGVPTPKGYLQFLPPIDTSFIKPEEIRNNEWAIEIVYSNSVETIITAGTGPTVAFGYKTTLSGFIIPLSGELTNIKKAWGKEIYTYTYLFLFSNLEKPVIATTRTPQKIKNILTHKFDIPIP